MSRGERQRRGLPVSEIGWRMWGQPPSALEIYKGGEVIRAEGTYGEEGYVYQQYTPVPSFEDNFVTIGSWIIGDSPAGIGLREDATEITMNTSRFVPHYFD